VHFGNNAEDLDYVARILDSYPNVYVDLAARLPEIGRHEASRVRELFIRHQDRILFATDIAIGQSRQRGFVLTLGSSGTEDATREEIPTFYARHHEWLETDHVAMAHPTPIQGNWTIDAIGLPAETLDRIYYLNAYELVVAPWMARNQPQAQ
jgi:predicted TIM-barrel fold metal-dependent hydrolase